MIGAAHRRRGQPCQDASLAISLSAPGSPPLQLMAVADGHGNRRHWLSEVGSALACEQAQQAVQAALASTPLRERTRWRELLQRDLPTTIVQGWLAAIEADWQRRPEASEQAFSASPYGCTLGLVLMAPEWWGCTGLGDWDLVALQAGQPPRLISEETTAAGRPESAEATASLCGPGAAQLWAERVLLQPRASGEQTLVLSTDGVRKSCATDGDFLTLCAALAEITTPAELTAGLEQITAEGSGDDVSVAMGHAAASPHRARPIAIASAIGLALLAAGAGWWWTSGRVATPIAEPPEDLPAAVRLEIDRQCAQPQRIGASLNQRRPQLQQLTDGHADQARAMLASAERDPLGALLAASRLGRLRGCPSLEQELQRQWQWQRQLMNKPVAGSSPGLTPGGRMPADPPMPPPRQR